MSLKGKRTKVQMGATLPVDVPVYHRKPFYF